MNRIAAAGDHALAGADRILVATRSSAKLAEIRELLGGLEPELVSLVDAGLPPEPEKEQGIEVHASFARNALAKARHFRTRTGLPTLADDSGLCVEALERAPGVHSRRFAGGPERRGAAQDTANNAHLIERLRGVPAEERTAFYECALALVDAPVTLLVAGRVWGHIASEARGAGGFGYDPLFVPEGEERTYAELGPEMKRATSHRARAAARLSRWLQRVAKATG